MDTNLSTKMLSSELITKAANHGFLFKIQKTELSLIESPRNDEDSVWVGIDVDIPSPSKVGCAPDDSNYIDTYIKNILKLDPKKVVSAPVYQAMKLKDYSLRYSTNPDFGEGHSKPEVKSFIYQIVKLVSGKKVSTASILENISYQVEVFSDARNGDVYDLFLTDLSDVALDEVLVVYNTDSEAVENYCEEMLDIETESYLANHEDTERMVRVQFSEHSELFEEMNISTMAPVLKLLKQACGDSFLVGNAYFETAISKSEFDVVISSIPLFSSINHKSSDNMFEYMASHFAASGMQQVVKMNIAEYIMFLAMATPYKDWDKYLLSSYCTALIDYAHSTEIQRLVAGSV